MVFPFSLPKLHCIKLSILRERKRGQRDGGTDLFILSKSKMNVLQR